jgi:hypothetical protein
VRWIRVLAATAFVAPSACSAVLGLDAPTLDPCAGGSCADAAQDAPTDSPREAGTDAGADAPPPAGIRCGGGAFGVKGCDGQTPSCCQLTDDAGTTSYACRPTGGCEGYEIKCASNADCAGNDVCCQYSTHIVCTGNACPNGALVCEPDGATDQCPTGWSCKAVATLDGVTSAYFECGQ